eukprot:5905683-Pyramimonas_sp.AAC.2
MPLAAGAPRQGRGGHDFVSQQPPDPAGDGNKPPHNGGKPVRVPPLLKALYIGAVTLRLRNR